MAKISENSSPTLADPTAMPSAIIGGVPLQASSKEVLRKDTIAPSPGTVTRSNVRVSGGNPKSPNPAASLSPAQIASLSLATQTAKLGQASLAHLSINAGSVFGAAAFSMNFTALLASILNQIASINTAGAYLDAQDSLRTRLDQFKKGLEEAVATQANYNAQADEQRSQATTYLLHAATAFASLSLTLTGPGRAKRSYDAEVEQQKAKVEIARPKTTGAGIEEGNEADFKAAQKKLEETKSQETHIVQQKMSHSDNANQLLFKVVDSGIDAANASKIAALKALEGVISALEQTLRTIQQADNSHLSQVEESKKALQDAIEAAIRAKQEINSANRRSIQG